MERIALVNICLPPLSKLNIAPPQGILTLATTLLMAEMDFCIYDTAYDINYKEYTPDNIADYLLKIPERIIGISSWDSVLPKIIIATKILKEKKKEKIIVLGGPSVTALGNTLLNEFDWIDYLIIGEGEIALVSLMSYLDNHITKNKLNPNVNSRNLNIINKRNGSYYNSHKRIPVIDYSKLLLNKYNRAELLTSRGCPFQCSFCSVNIIGRNRIKYRNIFDIEKEIFNLKQLYSFDKCIHILDDNFCLKQKRFENICGLLSKFQEEFNWSCYFRIDDLSDYNLNLLSKSNCVGLYIGIENISYLKTKYSKSNLTKIKIVETLKSTSKLMNLTLSFIWGFPDETCENLLDTLNFINELLEIENIFIELYQLSPLTGTAIAQELKGKIKFDKDSLSGFIYPPYLPKLDENEIELIKNLPDIFSSFYHEDSALFNNKQKIINKFLFN